MSENIRPIRDQVLCRYCDPDKVSKGGILLPDNAKKQSRGNKAVIAAIGPDVKANIQIGQTIFLEPYCGTNIDWQDVPHVLVSESKGDLLAVLDFPD